MISKRTNKKLSKKAVTTRKGLTNRTEGGIDDITSHEQDVSHDSIGNEGDREDNDINFVDRSAFKILQNMEQHPHENSEHGQLLPAKR